MVLSELSATGMLDATEETDVTGVLFIINGDIMNLHSGVTDHLTGIFRPRKRRPISDIGEAGKICLGPY